MGKRIKGIGALVLAGVLVCSAFVLPEVYAALGVKTDRSDCSVIVDVANNVPNTALNELKTHEVTVNLYKVAEIKVTGQYDVLNKFEEIMVSDEGETKVFPDEIDKRFDTLVSKVNSGTTAAQWEKLAETVKKAVTESDITATGKTEAGRVTINSLNTGLYLVDAKILETDDYEYVFKPYLISLPNNYYNTTQNDEWIYQNVQIGLKPEKVDRYGDLIIRKTLDVYNATNPNATFVFQVEASKTDEDTGVSEVVYSNVVSTAFTEAGTKEIRIEKIPAGASVIVTEVYSGASYQITSSKEISTTIIAKEKYDIDQDTNVTNETDAAVEFTNTHSGIPHGGSGVINNFKYDKTWNWSKIDPATGAAILNNSAD